MRASTVPFDRPLERTGHTGGTHGPDEGGTRGLHFRGRALPYPLEGYIQYRLVTAGGGR